MGLTLHPSRAVATGMAARPISIHSTATLEEIPELKQLARKRREWALRDWLVTGRTPTGFAICAECTSCRASIHGWQAHLGDRVEQVGTGNASVRLAYPGACSVCGASLVDVFAESIGCSRQ